MSDLVTFLFGALVGFAFTSAWWYYKMGRAFAALAQMAGSGHIPDADEVAKAFGLREGRL